MVYCVIRIVLVGMVKTSELTELGLALYALVSRNVASDMIDGTNHPSVGE